MTGKPGDPLAFFAFTSFLRPNTIYSLDMNSLEIKVFKAPKIDFNPDLFTTEQVWYASKDGTKVPMFITRKKNIAYDGQNPTLLYGYGGFNISALRLLSVLHGRLCWKTTAFTRLRIFGAAVNLGKNGTRQAPNAKSKMCLMILSARQNT